MKVSYNPKLKNLARELRTKSTLSEVLLWNHLKSRKMAGFDFHRQKPIDEYIVDFFCPKLRLIIEIDGASHEWKGQADNARAERLSALGFHILRFDDKDIKRDLDNVLIGIRKWISDNDKSE